MDELRFQWNEQKAKSNLRKHGISFEEAATVFNDPRRLQTYDLEHSLDEDREDVIGFSYRMRLLMVVIYEQNNDVIRIISARRARARKASATLPKVNVRYVEFTPEEMAIDCPEDISDPKRYPTITRGDKDWKKFVNFRNGFARLDPELRKVFPTNRSVNAALRNYLRLREGK